MISDVNSDQAGVGWLAFRFEEYEDLTPVDICEFPRPLLRFGAEWNFNCRHGAIGIYEDWLTLEYSVRAALELPVKLLSNPGPSASQHPHAAHGETYPADHVSAHHYAVNLQLHHGLGRKSQSAGTKRSGQDLPDLLAALTH